MRSRDMFWLMTSDEASCHDPVADYIACGSQAISKMGCMLYSVLEVRRAAAAAAGWPGWSPERMPKLTLVVDEGIDIGDLADAIVQRGRPVGVFLRVWHRSVDGL